MTQDLARDGIRVGMRERSLEGLLGSGELRFTFGQSSGYEALGNLADKTDLVMLWPTRCGPFGMFHKFLAVVCDRSGSVKGWKVLEF